MLQAHSNNRGDVHSLLHTPITAAAAATAAATATAMTKTKTTATDAEDTSTITQTKPIACPLVLQCVGCKMIVGDTCSVVDLNPDLRTITLEKKSNNVMVDEELHTSKDKSDYGSTYHHICCRHCQMRLGRMYRTTSPELDMWRGLYTFSSDHLAFYELSADIYPANTANVTSNGAGANYTEPSMEIVKLQKFCVYLYERVTSLEEELRGLQSSSSSVHNVHNDNDVVDHMEAFNS